MKPTPKIKSTPPAIPAQEAGEKTAYDSDHSEVKYQNLVSQLNPHFLFNSLATLESLIYSDQRLAVKFLSQLTRVYRYVLTTRHTKLVTLGEELCFIKDYADLLQTRFGKGLEVCLNVPEAYHSYQIVPTTLQILIENATRHNLTDPDSPLLVTITTENQRLIIENNLQIKRTLEVQNRQGLSSLRNLYAYFSETALEIQQTPEFFRIVLPLL
ncbi:sensor histidine kinase [Runella salmonicolor]|uniref:Histidine kinase n=1 Tax=Runella salmonicolor TaxID=2950278 RepID=A0ABT1FHA3_9BACT|nr:histidine kinase [Runella salmonicolor]MCP1381099.1 histidine kinase [Runella salmonicolor]